MAFRSVPDDVTGLRLANDVHCDRYPILDIVIRQFTVNEVKLEMQVLMLLIATGRSSPADAKLAQS